MITFNKESCSNLGFSAGREWLVTNGIGGFACGTVARLLTRRYHGLLIAALKPPVERTLLVTKLEETVTYQDRTYDFAVNRWRNGYVSPDGYRWLREFRLEGTTPVWTFSLGNASLEKRIWMQYGENTTYIRYDFLGGEAPVTLDVKPLVNYRAYHSNTHAHDWRMQIDKVDHGLRLVAFEGAVPFFVLSDRADVALRHDWVRDFYLNVEAYRGYDAYDDHLTAGLFSVTLNPGESLTFAATTEAAASLDGVAAYDGRRAYEAALVEQAGSPDDPRIRQLVLAADQFLVCRPTACNLEGRTVIAGYPWFTDFGRDTMIGLPGLTLVTGRPAVARSILQTYAEFVDEGMLPNRFPDVGETPEYNTVDATLWYFQALRAYHVATGDDDVLRTLFPVLQEIITWYQRGTRYHIHVDPADGLLYAGEPGVQLTWMDAKVGDWVVTPRTGKAVEINALWYNALRTMAAFARRLGVPDAPYDAAADRIFAGFERFWNPARGFCFDVIDGPDGDEDTLRPNQLFAVSLPFTLLDADKQRAIVDICESRLFTTGGIRSMAYIEPAYIGHYGGGILTRDAAYHQGTAWGWLVGPFVSAHLRVYNDLDRARALLQPLLRNLEEHGVGSLSEIFDGDLPYAPRGCIAQAWSVAEVLRVWKLLEGGGVKAQ